MLHGLLFESGRVGHAADAVPAGFAVFDCPVLLYLRVDDAFSNDDLFHAQEPARRSTSSVPTRRIMGMKQLE